MTDLLTPDEVKNWLVEWQKGLALDVISRLCRDYLTLWDRNKALETTIGWYEAKHPND